MSLSKLLDETISEPPPPFRYLEDLIAGERRRQRMRRVGGAVAGTAGALAVAFGVQAFVGTAGGPPVGALETSGPPVVTASSAPPRSPTHSPAIVDPPHQGDLRVLPPDPVIGTVYAFDLYSHCGINLARFAGANWRAEQPDDGRLPGPYIAGTMQLLDADSARFVIDRRYSTEREVILFRKTTEEIPPCL